MKIITQSEKFRHDIVQICADAMTNGYRFNYTNESSLRNPNNIPKGGGNKFNTQFINYSQLIIIFYTLNFVNI